MPQRKTKKTETGPQPERLKIDGDWEDAVKKALDAKQPPKNNEKEGEAENDDD